MSINVINHMICKWGGGNISCGYEIIWPLHSSVPTKKKFHEKNGIRDAGVAPWILSVCTRCGTQESSEYSISGNYDESGDLKKIL